MFEVTYYEVSNDRVDEKVDAVRFLYLLELYATGKYVKAMSANFQGKCINCDKLLRSLKFV